MLDKLRALQARLEDTPHLHRIGALLTETVLLKIDGGEYFLVFEKGHLTDIVEGPSKKTPYRFAIVVDALALEEFWKPRPKPGFHDLFAMVKIGRAEILGDILLLTKNLRFFKEFLALGRFYEEGTV